MPEVRNLTAEDASAELATVGLRFAAKDIRLHLRDDRWCAILPGDRMAWFAASKRGRSRLETERRVLRTLAARCTFAAPRILKEAPDGSFDVRKMVPGTHDPMGVFLRVRYDAEAAARVGTALGEILAEQHTRVSAADVAAWLPRSPSWPEPRAWIRERLPRVVDDRNLHEAADQVIALFEEVQEQVADADCVLVHTDLGFHNVSMDQDTLEVRGVFDWESACWADRHLDFRYLLVDFKRFYLLDAALAAYESAARVRISRARVMLCNAACAVSYLAFRAGIAPEKRWCGRTLDEDLAWTRAATANALESLGRGIAP